MSAKRFVIESNIPAAEARRPEQFGRGLTRKQLREAEDITAWMQMQEEAELDLIRESYEPRRARLSDERWHSL